MSNNHLEDDIIWKSSHISFFNRWYDVFEVSFININTQSILSVSFFFGFNTLYLARIKSDLHYNLHKHLIRFIIFQKFSFWTIIWVMVEWINSRTLQIFWKWSIDYKRGRGLLYFIDQYIIKHFISNKLPNFKFLNLSSHQVR